LQKITIDSISSTNFQFNLTTFLKTSKKLKTIYKNVLLLRQIADLEEISDYLKKDNYKKQMKKKYALRSNKEKQELRWKHLVHILFQTFLMKLRRKINLPNKKSTDIF
jgi:hypothetical protein